MTPLVRLKHPFPFHVSLSQPSLSSPKHEQQLQQNTEPRTPYRSTIPTNLHPYQTSLSLINSNLRLPLNPDSLCPSNSPPRTKTLRLPVEIMQSLANKVHLVSD